MDDYGCRHGNHTELFVGDALPFSQAEEGIPALEVCGWTKADNALRLLIIYIIQWSVLFM